MGGRGRMQFDDFDESYSFRSRMEDGPGTNPEELIGAALAGCFAMALALELTQAGSPPRRVQAHSRVSFGPGDGGFMISRIELATEAEVPDIARDRFQQIAAQAKLHCPVSRALSAVEITLDARLLERGAERRIA